MKQALNPEATIIFLNKRLRDERIYLRGTKRRIKKIVEQLKQTKLQMKKKIKHEKENSVFNHTTV